MANNCPRIFLTTKRRPSYLLSTTGLFKPRSQVRPPSAHTTNSVQQMCKTSTKPTLPHLQPPRAIETHSANFRQTAGWGQTYPPRSVFERSHPGCASQPFHSTYAGWFLPSHLISSLVPISFCSLDPFITSCTGSQCVDVISQRRTSQGQSCKENTDQQGAELLVTIGGAR